MLSKVMAMELGPHKVGFFLRERKVWKLNLSISSQSSLIRLFVALGPRLGWTLWTPQWLWLTWGELTGVTLRNLLPWLIGFHWESLQVSGVDLLPGWALWLYPSLPSNSHHSHRYLASFVGKVTTLLNGCGWIPEAFDEDGARINLISPLLWPSHLRKSEMHLLYCS